MKQLFTLFILASCSISQAKPIEIAPEYWLESSTKDITIDKGYAIYEFNFNGAPSENQRLVYSIDGKMVRTKLENSILTIRAKAGTHSFQLYYSSDYQEVFTGKIEIKSQMRDRYVVDMRRTKYLHEVEKPVIYLYPEVETTIEVKMNIKGSNPFLYPAYKDSWNFVAKPNGDLIFGDRTYNYLFWESSQSAQEGELDLSKGFIVSGQNITSLLEKSLTKYGFTSKEKADFITFWAPQMQDNPFLYICYMYDDACDKFAELSITPEPDVLARFYMLWSPVSEKFNSSRIEEQEIPTMDRTGFVVLEWGGMEIDLEELKAIN